MTLHAAIRDRDAAAMLDRLRAGADANARDPEGLTPLMIAAGHGEVLLAEILLAAGADVHAIEPRMGATALHKAAQGGNPDMVALLLRAGAFVDQQTPIVGNTPLIDAVLHRHAATVDRLLLGGARTAIANHSGQTALAIAREDGADAIAARIAAHDRALAGQVAGLTLIAAVTAGDDAAVEQALAEGASPDQQMPMAGSPDDNYTALGIAARQGHLAIARQLLDAGADPGRVIGLMRGTALHDATYFGHPAIVRLLTAGDATAAGLRLQGAYNGMTALHDAVWQRHADVVRALIDAGAPLDLRDHSGATPRDLALRHRQPELAALLARAEQDRSDPTR